MNCICGRWWTVTLQSSPTNLGIINQEKKVIFALHSSPSRFESRPISNTSFVSESLCFLMYLEAFDVDLTKVDFRAVSFVVVSQSFKSLKLTFVPVRAGLIKKFYLCARNDLGVGGSRTQSKRSSWLPHLQRGCTAGEQFLSKRDNNVGLSFSC